MNEIFKIKFQYKESYSYGSYHAGFDMFDSIYLENLTNLAFSNLKLQINTYPNILLTNSSEISPILPFGYDTQSCDFLKLDISYLASIQKVEGISITISIFSAEGELLHEEVFSADILPYFYFSGVNVMPETAAFFVTPSQEELKEIAVTVPCADTVDYCHQLFEHIKSKRITLTVEDYFGSNPLPVKLPERVLKERFANSFEVALLFASACESAGFSPLIAFSGKGRVYAGFSLRNEKMPLISALTKSKKNLDKLYFIDSSHLVLGSDLGFDASLYQSKNAIALSDDRIILLSIAEARKYHLLPLPNRIYEDGQYILVENNTDNASKLSLDVPEEYLAEPRISSILKGELLSSGNKKGKYSFHYDLDVNQNKILSKILSNDFTLIKAQSGSGVSTIFSKATAQTIINNKNILYITDADYHCDSFYKKCTELFDDSFIWDLLDDKKKTYTKNDFQGIFEEHSSIYEKKEAMSSSLEAIDSYYTSLEGEHRIVSSFLVAADRYHQLQDADDTLVFSPEQVGMLTDDKVQSWFSSINDMVRCFAETEEISHNPLMLVQRKAFSYEFKSKFIRLLEDILRNVEALSARKEQLFSFFPSFSQSKTLSATNAFCDLVGLLTELTNIPEALFHNPDTIESNYRMVASVIQAHQENEQIKRNISVIFQDSVFDLDAVSLYERFVALDTDKGFKTITQKHSIIKNVKRYLKPNCDVENAEYVLSRLSTYQKNRQLIKKERERLFELFSVADLHSDASWSSLQFVSDLCYQIYAVYQGVFQVHQLSDFICEYMQCISITGVLDKVSELRVLITEFSSLKEEFECTVMNDLDFFYPYSPNYEIDYFTFIYEKLSNVLSLADRLKAWCNWLEAKDNAISLGLKNVIVSLENGKIEQRELKKIFLRAFFKAICEYNFIVHPELIPENLTFDKNCEIFENAKKDFVAAQKAEYNSILSMNRFDAFQDLEEAPFSPDELYVKKPKLLSSIFPCIISNLNQAKTMFADKKDAFDLILIESRERIAVKDILWVFYAGKKIAFAGDFDFSYQKRLEESILEKSSFGYLWKIVDEKYSLSASYASLPELVNLRSQFTSSISLDTRLYTVPSPFVRPVTKLVQLQGVYDGEFANANLEEAQFIVNALIEFALQEEEKSIAVIAATEEQKNLILRLLAQKMRHQEDLLRLFSDYSRFFVVSMKDSLPFCDSVLFTTVYSPNRSVHGSRLPYELLEFAGKDPYKMILKILSCARESFTLVTGLTMESIHYSPSVLPTHSALKTLIQLVNAPTVNNSFRMGQITFENAVIRRVKTELEEKGFRTAMGIQSGRYYIDLAVLNNSGNFALGIISDNSVLNQKSNIAAIELGNKQFYEKHGWKLYRLRSPNCFDSFTGEMEKILMLLS